MLYPKIPAVFKRDAKTRKLIPGDWVNDDIANLARLHWTVTEKIDGTNIRVIWDGYRVKFAGRTDKSDIPAPLTALLDQQFGGPEAESLFEQTFGPDHAVIFGEGYGGSIQGGGGYGPTVEFVAFDICVNGIFLPRWSEDEVAYRASKIGLGTVPNMGLMSLDEVVKIVSDGLPSRFRDGYAEGLVAIPVGGFLDHFGERIAVKVKHRDIWGLDVTGRGVAQ